jgi:hypothetical protein
MTLRQLGQVQVEGLELVLAPEQVLEQIPQRERVQGWWAR